MTNGYVSPVIDSSELNMTQDYVIWYVVAIFVLLLLGGSLMLGMAVWCVVKQHGTFSGSYTYKNGYSIQMACTRQESVLFSSKWLGNKLENGTTPKINFERSNV